jgi:hypothetical protein
MRVTPFRIPVTAVMFAGVALMLSCSDGSSGAVDAAICDCAGAEPPIAGRVVIVNQTQSIAANSVGSQDTGCPAGAQLLSGSCTTANVNPGRDVTLQQSGFYGEEQGWRCVFRNNEATPVTIKVSLICLMPPS